ncbi:MAG: 2-hydroxy-6-oxo-6-phenylhexa-2,4-dienoate hydrolase [Phycisphaerales bacterium]|nr:2-hydroxy-6-oxo-6-phenylhexa-2,4-dienoate hydrolase [Phycisphaerales bacterium]
MALRTPPRCRGLSASLVLLIVAGTASVARPAEVPQATVPATRPAFDQPLGIGLEAFAYPHPVRFLPLTIDGQDVRMAYMDVPPAGRQPGAPAPATTNPAPDVVVLLHGKNFGGAYWADTIAALTAAGHRVVVPDQVGFGKSGKPDVAYSFDLLAANTAALLDHLRVERAAVVGHSMGGMLAVRFARTHPRRVTRLVLENPIGLEDWRAKGVPPRTTEDVYQSELKQSGDAVRAYFKTAYFAHTEWRPEWDRLVEPAARVALSGEFPRWAQASALTYQMIYQQPVRHEFPLVAVPTLLVIGQADRTALGRAFAPEAARAALGDYPRLGREAAKDIPNARLVELEGVGHIPHVEAAERFHDALLPYLR